MWKKLHINKRRFFYAICFLALCFFNQRNSTLNSLNGWVRTFRDLTITVMLVLILFHYRLSDYKKRKLPYLVWTLICAVGGATFLMKGQSLIRHLNVRIVLVLNCFLLGVVLIHLFTHVVLDKQRPQFNKYFAWSWLAMMLLMVVSRSNYQWPLVYLIVFGCFYLIDYTQEEQEDLFQGMLDGFILSFFLMQGWCFAFRPYDVVRYRGVYANCNNNALFYLVVLAAVLAKLFYVYRKNCSRWIKIYYWLGVGTLLAFLFLTIGRTGWMTAAVLVFAALLFLRTVTGDRNFIKSIVKNGLITVLCFCLTFPLVFGAVRYLPPAFHHPVWFWGEWNEDKVHSWDKWDSEKFVDLDELFYTALKRVVRIVDPSFEQEEKKTEETELPEITPRQQQLYDEMLAAGFAMDPADMGDAVVARKTIYRYYAHLLNFRGHPTSEQNFQMLPQYNYAHAHNIYLQYGVDFGIPMMCLFIALIVWSGIGFVRQFRRERSEQPVGHLLFLLVPAVFGLLELCWGHGSITIPLLFILWRRMIRNETGR